MPKVTWIRQRSVDASRASRRRERASIDLRGHAPLLNAIALSMHMSVAALVRTVLAEWLETHGVDDADRWASGAVLECPVLPQQESSIIKVTLRMPAAYAAKLARAARGAEVSQGFYVTRLLHGHPPGPLAPDQRESRAALMQSTAMLAAMSIDLQAFMRALRRDFSPEEAAACSATVALLSDVVRQHLNRAAPLLAALTASRHPAAGDSD